MMNPRVCILALLTSCFIVAPSYANVEIDFNSGSNEFSDNFVEALNTENIYSAAGGSGGVGGMMRCASRPSYFVLDPGSGGRTFSDDTTVSAVFSGDHTIGFDFKAAQNNDSFGVWFYDGATEGNSRPAGNARMVLLNVNASGATERIRWWQGGTIQNNSIGSAVRDINPSDTAITTGLWYHAEVELSLSGSALTATFSVWNQDKTTLYFSDTHTFSGVTQTGGQVGFRINAVNTTIPPSLDYVTVGAAPSTGDPGNLPSPDAVIDFNTGSTQFSDNFVRDNASNSVYSSIDGSSGLGGKVNVSGSSGVFLYDPGVGDRFVNTDTEVGAIYSGNFTVGFDFRAGSNGDSFGVWFYDGAQLNASRPVGAARMMLFNVNNSGSQEERVRWWESGTAHTSNIGSQIRDITPSDTTLEPSVWYRAELSLSRFGTDLTGTLTVWDRTRSVQYFSDTYTYTGVTESGGQVAFRLYAVNPSAPPSIDYITLGSVVENGDPGISLAPPGPGNSGGAAVNAQVTSLTLPVPRNIERRFPSGTVIDPTQSPYFADNTGVADATAAIQAALDAGINQIVWLPNGTYKISDTLRFSTEEGDNHQLIGQSRDGVVLQLIDSASGFTNPASPKSVVVTGIVDSGNASPNVFGRFISNLTINTGTGNSGAIALHYFSNNFGAARDLLLRSEDGQGYAGLDVGRTRNNGPFLVQYVEIEGFDYGIRSGEENGLGSTFEHIVMTGQNTAGIYNERQQMALRNVHCFDQTGPAIWNTEGHLTLVEGSFNRLASSATEPAIRNEAAGQMLLRGIETVNYGQAVEDPTFPILASSVNEWISGASQFLFETEGRTLNLPIIEPPHVPYDDPSTWVDVTAPPFNARDSNLNGNFDNASNIQAAIDSGAETLYVPANAFLKVKSPIYLRGNVKRIIGLGGRAAIVGDGSMAEKGLDPAVILSDGTAPVVVWDGLNSGVGPSLLFGTDSERTLHVMDSVCQGGVFSNAGDVFLEGVVGGQVTNFTFNGGGRVFARQFNPEGNTDKTIVSNNTELWILGYKTEKPFTILDASGGSMTEILGAFVYAIDSADGDTMFQINDARASFNFFEYLYGDPYTTLVSETQGGVKRTIGRGVPDFPATYERLNEAGFGSQMVLYTSADQLTGLSVRTEAGIVVRGDTTPSLEDGTDFGGAQVANTAIEQIFAVQNLGDSTLNFTTTPRVAIAGAHASDFTLNSDLPASLAPGEIASMTVVFAPQDSGIREATISIDHDQDGSPFAFSIAGEGIPPAPVVQFEPSVLDFAVVAGDVRNVSFEIVNDGFQVLSGTLARNTGDTYFVATSDDPGGPVENAWQLVNAPTQLSGFDAGSGYVTATFDLPFAFPYYGSSFSKARLSENGIVMLENMDFAGRRFSSNFFNSSVLAGSVGSDAALFPYWDLLTYLDAQGEVGGSSAYYGLSESDPDSFVITYENASFKGFKRTSFQAVLGVDGSVRFNYLDSSPDGGYTVGIRKDTTLGINVYINPQDAPVRFGHSILFTPPVSWITSLSPASESVVNVPVQDSVEVTMAIDATGLSAGTTYRSLVKFSNTNDPDEPFIWLPVNLRVVASDLEAWRYNNFNTIISNGTAANNSNPDGDDQLNLIEYVLGSDPLDSSSRGQIDFSMSSNRLQMSFTPQVNEGLIFRVDRSPDLADWTDQVDVTNSISAGVPYQYTDEVTTSQADSRFIRLSIEETSN